MRSHFDFCGITLTKLVTCPGCRVYPACWDSSHWSSLVYTQGILTLQEAILPHTWAYPGCVPILISVVSPWLPVTCPGCRVYPACWDSSHWSSLVYTQGILTLQEAILPHTWAYPGCVPILISVVSPWLPVTCPDCRVYPACWDSSRWSSPAYSWDIPWWQSGTRSW